MSNIKEYFNQLNATLAVKELDNDTSETISGGFEVFTIRNKTLFNITYTLDGGRAVQLRPNQSVTPTAFNGGIIKYDSDRRAGFTENVSYNLADGRVYEFQNNNSTPGNPYDIQLYTVA